METMKVVRIHEFGDPEVLRYEEVPRSEPVQGEVMVRTHAAGVCPADWKVRQGYRNSINEDAGSKPTRCCQGHCRGTS